MISSATLAKIRIIIDLLSLKEIAFLIRIWILWYLRKASRKLERISNRIRGIRKMREERKIQVKKLKIIKDLNRNNLHLRIITLIMLRKRKMMRRRRIRIRIIIETGVKRV